MYKNFFGLSENPFNVNPYPRFLYLTLQTQKALDELTYGIQNRKGLILLTGEVGTGKTTLINCLLDWLCHWKTPTAFIFNSRLSTNHFFEFILTDFGIPIDIQLKSSMLMRFNTWLIECFRSGKSPVLIVDEAQGLSSKLLEEIRLLANLETPSEKLLQIVLAGQPELEDKLKRPELRQLRQRIALLCSTRPLAPEESRGYITERLRIGGAPNLQAPSHATSLPELVAFDAFEESALTARNSTVTTARHPEAISASMANSNAAAFLKDSMLASAGPEVKSKESALCLNSIPRVSGSAIPLNTEKKQNQVTNLASAPLHVIHSRTDEESSSAAKRSPISDAQSRTLRSSRRPVIHAVLLSWKSWSSQWVTGFLPAVSLAEWSHVSLVALRRIRQSVFLGRALLRRWKCEFKRDWIAMINAGCRSLVFFKGAGAGSTGCGLYLEPAKKSDCGLCAAPPSAPTHPTRTPPHQPIIDSAHGAGDRAKIPSTP